MKIAVIGSGISGLGASYIAQHNGAEVHLFESANYFGGHSNTIMVNDGISEFPVDTGFLVHNPNTYPHLIALLKHLDVETVNTEMTLSIQIPEVQIEWGGTDLNSVFIQRKNIFNIRFLKMLLEILDFNKRAKEFLELARQKPDMTLGELLNKNKFSEELSQWYLIPMAASIWSTPVNKIMNFPASSFLQFCLNHSLLQVDGRPIWRTIKGGSREYVKKITEKIPHKKLNSQIQSVSRSGGKVHLKVAGEIIQFDSVVFATHPHQTLEILSDASAQEQNILSCFQYQKNLAVVHSDEAVLPKNKKIWSAWNYSSSISTEQVSVSYLINKLQPLPTQKSIIVDLNPYKEIDPTKIIKKIDYEHPLFDVPAMKAQKDIHQIQGTGGVYHVGAWQRYGFHEDGLLSSVWLAERLNWRLPWS